MLSAMTGRMGQEINNAALARPSTADEERAYLKRDYAGELGDVAQRMCLQDKCPPLRGPGPAGGRGGAHRPPRFRPSLSWNRSMRPT